MCQIRRLRIDLRPPVVNQAKLDSVHQEGQLLSMIMDDLLGRVSGEDLYQMIMGNLLGKDSGCHNEHTRKSLHSKGIMIQGGGLRDLGTAVHRSRTHTAIQAMTTETTSVPRRGV